MGLVSNSKERWEKKPIFRRFLPPAKGPLAAELDGVAVTGEWFFCWRNSREGDRNRENPPTVELHAWSRSTGFRALPSVAGTVFGGSGDAGGVTFVARAGETFVVRRWNRGAPGWVYESPMPLAGETPFLRVSPGGVLQIGWPDPGVRNRVSVVVLLAHPSGPRLHGPFSVELLGEPVEGFVHPEGTAIVLVSAPLRLSVLHAPFEGPPVELNSPSPPGAVSEAPRAVSLVGQKAFFSFSVRGSVCVDLDTGTSRETGLVDPAGIAPLWDAWDEGNRARASGLLRFLRDRFLLRDFIDEVSVEVAFENGEPIAIATRRGVFAEATVEDPGLEAFADERERRRKHRGPSVRHWFFWAEVEAALEEIVRRLLAGENMGVLATLEDPGTPVDRKDLGRKVVDALLGVGQGLPEPLVPERSRAMRLFRASEFEADGVRRLFGGRPILRKMGLDVVECHPELLAQLVPEMETMLLQDTWAPLRRKCIQLLAEDLRSQVRDALLVGALHDPEPWVRLEAGKGLRPLLRGLPPKLYTEVVDLVVLSILLSEATGSGVDEPCSALEGRGDPERGGSAVEWTGPASVLAPFRSAVRQGLRSNYSRHAELSAVFPFGAPERLRGLWTAALRAAAAWPDPSPAWHALLESVEVNAVAVRQALLLLAERTGVPWIEGADGATLRSRPLHERLRRVSAGRPVPIGDEVGLPPSAARLFLRARRGDAGALKELEALAFRVRPGGSGLLLQAVFGATSVGDRAALKERMQSGSVALSPVVGFWFEHQAQ